MEEMRNSQRNPGEMGFFSSGKDSVDMDLGPNGSDREAIECHQRNERKSMPNLEFLREEDRPNVVIEMDRDEQGLNNNLEQNEGDNEYDDEEEEEENEGNSISDSSVVNSQEKAQKVASTKIDSSTLSTAQGDEAVFRGLEEGKSPLWIKWRGKWQAGIQCCLEDCPAQTVKAMPTYGRKSYIVVFFPSNRSFVWTDWQLVCSITENPEPLSVGSHESGRNSVLDLNAAKTYMLRKITNLMLDISDELPITAVEDGARDVSFWKDFANATAKSATYQELGSTLVKLKSMILSSLIKEDWINTCSLEWEHQCRNADTAGSLEMLVKDLKTAICWNEVDKLWDDLEQGNLGSEWKSWKASSHHDGSNRGKAWYSSFSVTGHRRKFDALNCLHEGSEGQGGSGDIGNADSEQDSRRVKLQHGMPMKLEARKNLDKSSSLDVIGKSDNGVPETKIVRRSSQCLAFSDRKGRQCNRYPKEGSVYCCVHMPSSCKEELTHGTEQKKGKLLISHSVEDDADGVICSGVTKYGRRCSHKARNGSVFCLKHMLRDLEKPGQKATEKSECGVVESNIGTHHDVLIQEKGEISSISVNGHRRTFDAFNRSPDRNEKHGESGDEGNAYCGQDSKRQKLEQQLVLYSPNPLKATPVQRETGKDFEVSPLLNAISKAQNLDMKSDNGTGIVEAKNVRRSSQCMAFSDRKGRQCNRYPKEGSVYCCVHIPSGSKEGLSSTEEQKNGKLPISHSCEDDSHGMACSGLTRYGRRCTHKARNGSVFCLKHMLRDIEEPEKKDSEKTVILSLAAVTKSKIGTMSEHNISSDKRNIEQADAGQVCSSLHETSNYVPNMVARNGESTQCIGLCGSGVRCSHRAKPGFPYCEKHVPGLSPYANRGQDKSYSKDISGRIPVRKDEFSISRLKGIVNDYVRARLSNEEAQSSQHAKSKQKIIDMVLKEVSGNLKASESLYDIVTGEMENLKKLLEEKDALQVENCLVPSTGSVEHTTNSVIGIGGDKSIEQLSNVDLLKQVSTAPNGHISKYRCKLCAQEFLDLVVLGEHWRGYHKKEAQQYFRGYTCQFCNHPFTNKKALYRHRNARHSDMITQTKSSLLSPCIICNAQFLNFEDLWKHVICSHPDQLCAFWPVTDPSSDLINGPVQWQPSGLEIVNVDPEKHTQIADEKNKDPATLGPIEAPSHTTTEMRYKCKICGLKFPLLPDLGRHHQAQHKPATSIQFNEVSFSPGMSEELKPGVPLEKEKKRKAQKLNIRRAPILKDKAEAQIVTQNVRNWTMEEIEGHTGVKFESFPSDEDILTVAKSACCKNRLYSVLEKKYASLPDRLALKAAKICSEANIKLQFYQEGYVCPNSCKEVCLSTDVKTGVERLSNANLMSQQSQFNPAHINYTSALTSNNIVLDESHVVFTTVSSTTVSDNSCSKMILCEDLSFGKERMPIPCVLDRDVMGECDCPMCTENPSGHLETLTPWLHFSYVTKRTLDPSLEIDTESSRLGCSCPEHQCQPDKCEHVYLFDNDNTDAEDIYGRPMARRFPYDSKGCIILQERYLVYECNSLCSCSELCQNRVLQKGVQVKLEVYKTRHKGWAVRAAQHIPRGTFVCEYIGEVLDDFEANRRGERYDKEGCSYLYDIDAHIHIGRRGRPKPFVIDATKFGNVSRFINHSCSPNLVNYQVLVESMDCQLAHIGLYATRDINIGEELAYDYRYKLLPGRGCPCHCGAKDCRGRLY